MESLIPSDISALDWRIEVFLWIHFLYKEWKESTNKDHTQIGVKSLIKMTL